MHPDQERWRDQRRQRQRSGVVGGALATAIVVVAGLAYHQLATDPQRAGPLWAAHTLLTWLGIGADLGAVIWLFSGQGWDRLLGDLLAGLLGAALGGLASALPGPLGLAGQRSGIFGGWLAALLGAALLSGLRLRLQHHGRPAPARRAELSYTRGLCAAILLVPLAVLFGVALLVIISGYNG